MARPLLFLGVDGVLNPVLPAPDFAVYDILTHTVPPPVRAAPRTALHRARPAGRPRVEPARGVRPRAGSRR